MFGEKFYHRRFKKKILTKTKSLMPPTSLQKLNGVPLTGFTTSSVPSPHAVFARLFSIRFPHYLDYLRAWNWLEGQVQGGCIVTCLLHMLWSWYFVELWETDNKLLFHFWLVRDFDLVFWFWLLLPTRQPRFLARLPRQQIHNAAQCRQRLLNFCETL